MENNQFRSSKLTPSAGTLAARSRKIPNKMMKDSTLLKTNYKLTVGNLSSLTAIIMAIYYLIYPGEEGWGILIAILLGKFGILMFGFDLIIQRFKIKYLVINLIELLIAIVMIILFKK